jgi:hypothetical protein
MAGFLFKSSEISYRESLFIIGVVVIAVSAVSLLLSMSKALAQEVLANPFSAEQDVSESLIIVENNRQS